MGLPKGKTNNRNGRPTGSLNKISGDLRERITEFLENNFDEVIAEWKRLKGKEKLMFYKDLIHYSLPVLQKTEILDRNKIIELPPIIIQTSGDLKSENKL